MPKALSPSLTQLLLGWYAKNARTLPWRRAPGATLPQDPHWPYRVWLSEVMLQQTTVEAVKPYFAAFTTRWPTIEALAAAADEEVMHAWAGLGYYARARNLLACARTVASQHAGHFPGTEAELRCLPGLGAYSAAAIAAFAFGQRAIIIDGNIERVITRLANIQTPLPAARPEIAQALESLTPQGLEAADFAQGLMDLGRRHCTPKSPNCPACPLQSGCQAQAPETLPQKAAKRPRPTRQGTTWWLEAQGEVLTITRPPKGLLGGMTALPSTDWTIAPPPTTPPHPGAWQALGQITHGFTHFELHLSVHALILPQKPQIPGQWRPRAQVAKGLPTVFTKAATLALATLDQP
jgi:A/G-specific adenine glycosylase